MTGRVSGTNWQEGDGKKFSKPERVNRLYLLTIVFYKRSVFIVWIFSEFPASKCQDSHGKTDSFLASNCFELKGDAQWV